MIRPILMNEAGDGGNGGGTSTLLDGGGNPPAQQQQQQQVTAPTFVTDGAFAKGFASNLPDDLKPFQGSLQKFEGVPVVDVLKSYGALEQKLGQRVQMPAPDAKPEDVAAWRKITGAPDTADGYKIERPQDIPETAWNPELAKGFAEIAHKHHLAPSAVQEIVGWWNGQQKALGEQYAQQIEARQGEIVEGLKKDWGEKFDDNLHSARRVAMMAGLDPADPEIGNNPAMIRALHKVAALVSDDKEIGGGKGGPNLSATQQADDIQTNPQNPWYADYHGKNGEERQRAAQQRLMALRQSAR